MFEIKPVKPHSLLENGTHQFQLMVRKSEILLSGIEVISFITHFFMVFRNTFRQTTQSRTLFYSTCSAAETRGPHFNRVWREKSTKFAELN